MDAAPWHNKGRLKFHHLNYPYNPVCKKLWSLLVVLKTQRKESLVLMSESVNYGGLHRGLGLTTL